MSNEIATIPTNLPAHISSLFAQLSGINKEASDGISAGMFPLIKTSGTRFALVKDGEETIVKSLELKVVVLRAKAGFEKRYYEGAYDPNSTEAKAPDCYSLDGVRPAVNCAKPQNPACAGCWANEFGTGKDNNGKPSKGKACSDRKLIAVMYPNPLTSALEIYGLSLPPASLKAFGAYVQTLTANRVPLPAAFTTIGFDEKSTFPVLTFDFGGVPEAPALKAIIPMIESAEVKAIIDAKLPAVSSVAPAALAKPEPKPEPAKTDNGFGFTTVEPEKAKAPRKKAEPKVEAPVAETATEVIEADEEEISNDALSAMLGIKM